MTPERLINKVCHDLRAPLRAFTEVPEWIASDLVEVLPVLPETVSDSLNLLKTQAIRFDALVSDLSSYTCLTRNEQTPTTPLSEVYNIEDWPSGLQVKCETDLLPFEKAHAQTLISKLLDNAFKHSGIENPRVHLTLCQRKDFFHLLVADNGKGVAAEDLELIFEPLTTLQPRDQIEGSGMGLAIVARITKLYSGQYRAVNNANRGVTIAISIPNQEVK